MVPERFNSFKTVLLAHEDGPTRKFILPVLMGAHYNLIVADSGTEAFQKALAFDGHIHLLLANVEMSGMTGIELAYQLSRVRPDTRILLLSQLDTGLLVLNHGWQYLPKPFLADMLRDQIRKYLTDDAALEKHASLKNSDALVLNQGWQFLPVGLASDVLKTRIQEILKEPPLKQLASVKESLDSQFGLTSRERQVLKLIATGHSTKQVAAILGIAFKTSVGHRSRLMKKLNIHDSVTLVRFAIRAGIIEP
jgi:DNA-binding NarL/FixJ family response regulator